MNLTNKTSYLDICNVYRFLQHLKFLVCQTGYDKSLYINTVYLSLGSVVSTIRTLITEKLADTDLFFAE